MIWRGVIDKELCWSGVRSMEDIGMVYWNMRNDSRVVDEVYIKRGCLVLEDFVFFSLYSFTHIVMQGGLSNTSDCCLVLFHSIRTSRSRVLITLSHYCYQYHLHLTPPITIPSN